MIEDMVKDDTKVINMKISKKRLTQIVTEELKESMPAGVIRTKVEFDNMPNEKLLQYVEDRLSNKSDLQWYGQSEEFVEKKLREWAWTLGHGKMNPKYWHRYLDAKQKRSPLDATKKPYGLPHKTSDQDTEEPIGESERKMMQTIKEETVKYLKEEAYDCVKDYRLGGMTREEYCACLEHFGEQC